MTLIIIIIIIDFILLLLSVFSVSLNHVQAQSQYFTMFSFVVRELNNYCCFRVAYYCFVVKNTFYDITSHDVIIT